MKTFPYLLANHLMRFFLTIFVWMNFVGLCQATTLGNLTATFTTPTTIPVTDGAPSITAGSTATLTLAFPPSVGTQLTVIKNTGTAFISGSYANLAQGQTLALSHGGISYQFVANYYGGNGNDLVLVWKNNRLLGWGQNEEAKLGDGTYTDRHTPTSIPLTGSFAGKTLISTATGQNHSLALFSDGTVAAWGNNAMGQLGDGTTDERTAPVAVDTTTALAGKTVVAISAGLFHSLALCSDGTVVTWGDNGNGQLGNGSVNGWANPWPNEVLSDGTTALNGKTVVAIAAGPNHNLALCSDGSLVAWGMGFHGQLGNGASVSSSVAVAVNTSGVLASKTIASISAGYEHSIVLCDDGTIAVWGSGAVLGNGTVGMSNVPVFVSTSGVLSGRTPVAISAGENHNIALCSDGTLVSWGYNWYGQLGIGVDFGVHSEPTLVSTTGILSGKTVTSIHASLSFTRVLCSDGTLAAWGSNDYGQLGDDTTTQANSPVEVSAGDIVAGEMYRKLEGSGNGRHSLAIVDVPSSVGNLSFTFSTAATIGYTAPEVTISAGNVVTPALDFAPADGTELTIIKNTGNNYINGQFSNLSHGQTLSLTYAGTTYQFVANYYGGDGNDFVLVWKNNQLHAWGLNDNGEVGDGATVYRTLPVGVDASGVLLGKTIFEVSAGGNHTLALCSDGTVAAWGFNTYGQLGNGSTAHSSSPVAVTLTGVLAGKTVIAVSAGYNHSVALCSDGTLATWGASASYQLGNGSPIDSNVPVLVDATGVLAGKSVIEISAGGYHTLVRCSDGTLIAWGADWNGQLGDGGFGNGPVAVSTASGSSALHGKTVVAISAGGQHNMVLCSDGSVAAWGSNAHGVLGDGTTDTRPTPILVSTAAGSSFLSGKTVSKIIAGWQHSMALCSDGTVATWGQGWYGQLGIGSSTTTEFPTAVVAAGLPLGKTIAKIAGGGNRSVAIANDGTCISWGLVPGDGTSSSASPVAVDATGSLSGKTVIDTSTGSGHSVVICALPAVSASLPIVNDPSIGSLAGTSAQLGGNVTNDGGAAISERGVVFSRTSENGDPTIGGAGVTKVTGAGTTGAFSVSVSGLILGEEYVFKAYAINSVGTAYTWSLTFTTPTVPTVTSPTSAGITTTTVTLGGNVTATGGAGVFSRGIVYSLTSVNADPVLGGTGVSHVFEYAGLGVFTLPITNLVPGGQYSFKAYAENSVGHGYSSVGTFALQPVLPQVHSAQLAANLGTSAELSANVASDGGATITERGFVFSPSSSNTNPVIGGAGVIKVTASGTTGSYSSTITGLTSGVSYHFKAFATNSVGTRYSQVESFSAATAPVITLSRVTLHPTIATADLGGYLFSHGGAEIIERGVVYSLTSTDSDPHIGEPGVTKLTDAGGVGDFSIPVTGLTPLSGYSFRAYATNVVGTTYANVLTFQTFAAPSGNLVHTFDSATSVAVTTNTMVIAQTSTATLTLGYAPTLGTELTVVKNHHADFILGTYSNLAQGQTITLSYGGQDYDFIVNYYGGSGNDLVLSWKNTRIATWGENNYGQLANGNRVRSNVPVAAKAGALAGKSILKVATGNIHSVALTANGTVVEWGTPSNSTFTSPVAVGNVSNSDIVSIAAGNGFSLFLRSNGRVISLGRAFEKGQLGRLDPGMFFWQYQYGEVSQTGGLAGKKVTAIAAGESHALALSSDGKVAAWGENIYGKLGDGTTMNRTTPVAVDVTGALAGKHFVAIAAGNNHSLALCSDGTLVEWGRTVDSQIPVVVSPGVLAGKTITSIKAAGDHNLALCSDGTLAAWGFNTYGQLGTGNYNNSPVPVAVATTGALLGKTVIGIGAGLKHSVAYCSDGTAVAWGGDGCGELGAASVLESNEPMAVDMSGGVLGRAVVSAAAGDTYNVVITALGNQPQTVPLLGAATHSNISSRSVLLSGDIVHDGGAPITERGIVYSETSVDSDPVIGDAGVTKSVSAGTTGVFPLHVNGLTSATQYSYKTYAINSVGTTYSSAHTFSTLSVTSLSHLTADFASPSHVAVVEPVVAISGGSNITLSLNHEPAIGSTLTVINHTGLEPISGRFSNLAQNQVVTLTYAGCSYEFVANYFGGTGNDLVLRWRNSKAVAWGADYFGHLGNGTGPASNVPVETHGGINFSAIAANNFQSLALREDGRVFHWGLDWVNGDGNLSPTLRSGGVFSMGGTAKAVSVVAGVSHHLALLTDGQIVAWGENVFGQFGDGKDWLSPDSFSTNDHGPLYIDQTMLSEFHPIPLGPIPGKKVVSLAGGAYHSMALCSDGTVAAWGSNHKGQLGIGCKAEMRRPVMVHAQGALAGKVVVAIAAGWEHSLVLCSDGTLVSWGANQFGQLGDGSMGFPKTLPVAVDMSGSFAGKTVVAISAKGAHSLAMCSDGSVIAWGANDSGQLGNGTTTNSAVPIIVNSGALSGKTVASISAGGRHNLVLCTDGSVAAWGLNLDGQLGDGTEIDSLIPVLVDDTGVLSGRKVVSLAAGDEHSLALTAVGYTPTVDSPTSADVTFSTATLGGNVNHTGTSPVTERGVVLSLSSANTNPTIGGSGVTKLTSVGSAGTFTIPVTGLQSSKNYVFKAYAINATGISYSSVAAFQTLNAPPKVNGAFIAQQGVLTHIHVGSLATDSDGDSLTITTVDSTSEKGASIANTTSQISYQSSASFTGLDSFSITVSDGQGHSTTGKIVVHVHKPGNQIIMNQGMIELSANGDVKVLYRLAPATHYIVERSTDLQNWQPQATCLPTANGYLPFIDVNPPLGGKAFYRMTPAP